MPFEVSGIRQQIPIIKAQFGMSSGSVEAPFRLLFQAQFTAQAELINVKMDTSYLAREEIIIKLAQFALFSVDRQW